MLLRVRTRLTGGVISDQVAYHFSSPASCCFFLPKAVIRPFNFEDISRGEFCQRKWHTSVCWNCELQRIWEEFHSGKQDCWLRVALCDWAVMRDG
jgi:hypothetical protein